MQKAKGTGQEGALPAAVVSKCPKRRPRNKQLNCNRCTILCIMNPNEYIHSQVVRALEAEAEAEDQQCGEPGCTV